MLCRRQKAATAGFTPSFSQPSSCWPFGSIRMIQAPCCFPASPFQVSIHRRTMPKKKNGPLQHWKNAITRRSSSTKRLFPLSSPSKQKSTAEESKTLSSGVDSTTVVPATIYPPPLSSWTAFAEELPTTDPHVGPMTDKVSKAPNTRHDGAVITKPSSIDKSKSSITKRAPKRRDPQARAPTTKEVSFGTMRTLYSNSSRVRSNSPQSDPKKLLSSHLLSFIRSL